MQNGLYVSLSSQVALEKRLTTLADNVANMGTVGFRATEVKFEDLVFGLGEKSVSFASAGEAYLSRDSGVLEETGNSFDFALQGDAWFGVETPAGLVMTRDGRFTMTQDGQLITLDGHPVVDPGGAPIQLNPAGGPPAVSRDGALRQNEQLIGAIGLFAFEPGPNFVRYGSSGILASGEPEPIVDRMDAGVVQGFLENSNVNPVREMANLIMVQRAFDNVSALVRDTESTFDETIKALGSK